jgi:hypothetical protein
MKLPPASYRTTEYFSVTLCMFGRIYVRTVNTHYFTEIIFEDLYRNNVSGAGFVTQLDIVTSEGSNAVIVYVMNARGVLKI